MQVYRGMDVGTAKPDAADRARVPHHMIDLAEPEEAFTVARFQEEGRAVLAGLEEAGVPALVVGGSGLHFRSLVDPLVFPPSDSAVRAEIADMGEAAARRALLEADPEAAGHVDLANPRRVARALEIHRLTGATPSGRAATPEAAAVREYRSEVPLAAAYLDPGESLRGRVEDRFDGMLAKGLLAEVAGLAGRLGPTARQAVGYKQLLPVAAGRLEMEAGRRRAIDATRSLAARQRTFFGRDPRLVAIEWDDDPGRCAAAAAAVFEEAGWTS
jgi:tRNA dimethylallyltransferase